MSQEFVNKIFTRKIYDFYPLDTKRPYVTGNIRRSFLVRRKFDRNQYDLRGKRHSKANKTLILTGFDKIKGINKRA